MLRVKIVIVAAFAVLALSAIAASSASANWFVGGAELATGSKVAISTTAKVDSFAKLNLPVVKIKVECKGSVLRGTSAEIIGKTTGKAAKLTFEGCKTVEPASGCELEEETVPTQPIEAIVTKGSGTTDKVLFKPQTKTLFAEIPFKSPTTCALEGKQPVKGLVRVNAPTGQTESELQAIEGMGSVENNSLEVGSGNKAIIEGGNALLRLASGSKWSFH